MSHRTITVRGLKVSTCIGVPDEERAESQDLLIDLEMEPQMGFDEMQDEIDRTIDYHAVCLEIEAISAKGERRLIETLADEIADHILAKHKTSKVRVAIRKFILPQTEWVGVELEKRGYASIPRARTR